jgi:hypothetical protein
VEALAATASITQAARMAGEFRAAARAAAPTRKTAQKRQLRQLIQIG